MSEKITFYIATQPEYYGDGADQETIGEYIEFAREYLEANGYDAEIETAEYYPSYSSSDPRNQDELREQVWQAYLNR